MSLNEIDSLVDIENRTIIVVGKTGAGKSKLLNELIGKNVFKSSADIESCSEKIDTFTTRITTKLKPSKANSRKLSNEITFELKVIDTPGIADSQGRSKKFLNEIAETIKTTPLHLIVVLVEYGRFDFGLYNNLEILRECLNSLSQSSSMLIVNKVPTQKTLERKRRRGEECRDRKKVLDETYRELSDALGNRFKFKFFLENDESEEAEKFNAQQYEQIKKVILTRNSLLNGSKVKTWNEILYFYTRAIMNDQEIKNQMKELKLELEDKLDKVEYDIADIKYPYLEFLNERNLNLGNSLTSLECKITKDEYRKRNKYASHENVMLFVESDSSMESQWENVSKSVDEKLKNLDAKRVELNKELIKCQNSIDERKKMLDEKRSKLIRLENSLVNPMQILQ